MSYAESVIKIKSQSPIKRTKAQPPSVDSVIEKLEEEHHKHSSVVEKIKKEMLINT